MLQACSFQVSALSQSTQLTLSFAGEITGFDFRPNHILIYISNLEDPFQGKKKTQCKAASRVSIWTHLDCIISSPESKYLILLPPLPGPHKSVGA